LPSYAFLVTVDVSRESGLFAPRDDIVEALSSALEAFEPDLETLGANGDSVYVVDDVAVEEYVPPKEARE
jgi:hypothetical protein